MNKFKLSKWIEKRHKAQDTKAEESHEPDLLIFFLTILLLGIGTVIVFSASAVFAQTKFNDTFFIVKRHGLNTMAAVVILLIVMKTPYTFLKRWVYPIFIMSLILLFAIFLPGIGTVSGGARRWIRIVGFTFQPSEVAKLSLIIFLAYSLSRKEEKIQSFSIGFLPHVLIAGIMILMCLKQPDFGTSLTMAVVLLLMLFIAGTRLSYIVLAILSVLFVAYKLVMTTPYRLKRVLAFLDPWQYRFDIGYQVSESLISIGSGGLYGKGLGESQQKLFFLPEAHTDFIFSIFAEEAGLIGVSILLLLYAVLIYRCFKVSFRATDKFGFYLGCGITCLIAIEVFTNMAVTMGLLPTKGLTLPFISFGGSSQVATLIAVGIILNISQCAKQEMPQSKEARRFRPQTSLIEDSF